MTAKDSGKMLLGEVEVEGLDQVLLSVAKARLMQGDEKRFNIAPLDDLLENLRSNAAREDALRTQLPPSSSTRVAPTGATGKDSSEKILSIDVTGTKSGCGKTHLLYYITSIAVLPRRHGDVQINGKESAVIVLDCDGRFDVRRLSQIMTNHLTVSLKCGDCPNKEDISNIINTALKHVHIYQPQSLESAIATLPTITDYLFTPSSHQSSGRPLHSILLDGAPSFLWNARAADQLARIPGGTTTTIMTNNNATQTSANSLYATLLHRIRSVAQRFAACAVVTTSWSNLEVEADTERVVLRSAMPPSWTGFHEVRLVASRVERARFRPLVGLEEVLAEKTNDDKKGHDFELRVLNRGVEGKLRFSIGEEGMGLSGEERD